MPRRYIRGVTTRKTCIAASHRGTLYSGQMPSRTTFTIARATRSGCMTGHLRSSGSKGSPVRISWVQDGVDMLLENGVVLVRPKVLRYRSAFVGAVLSTLPGAAVRLRPGRVYLRSRGDPYEHV
jgi:hypothetical protein